MQLIQDMAVIRQLLFHKRGGANHQERLENFYGGQAKDYDSFRKRLLHGRTELYRSIPVNEGAVWVDFGGGTGSNFEALGGSIDRLKEGIIVDLCSSLLGVAEKRIVSHGWKNIRAVEADATSFRPGQKVDIVTFSYSLTMIPGWHQAIENALSILKPGGVFGVVDFFVPHKHTDTRIGNSWFTRHGWPAWFAYDDVFLSPDHLPFLTSKMPKHRKREFRAPVPWVPLFKVPVYQFIGRKLKG